MHMLSSVNHSVVDQLKQKHVLLIKEYNLFFSNTVIK